MRALPVPKKSPKRKTKPRGLTPQHEAFIAEYLLTGKQVHSYRHAFPGTSYGTAATLAGRLLKKVEIQKELDAARSDSKRAFQVKFRKVLEKFATLGFSDIGDVVDLTDPDRPRLKPREEIPAEARRAIKSIGRTAHGVRVTMHDQNAALKVLASHLGISTEITPLDALLAGLPAALREQVRQALAGTLPPGCDPPGTGGGESGDSPAVRGGVDAGVPAPVHPPVHVIPPQRPRR
ncbi:MAG: hypothetical protein C0467_06120 [Planctomycetaceae bacterium]|nr:hypothetical protein [Planctomycetaceae bacterium]